MIIFIVSIPFCVTAYADAGASIIIEFISTFLQDTLGAGKLDDMSPSEIVDYMSSPDGSFYRSVNELFATGFNLIGALMLDSTVSDELDDALIGQYNVAQMNADAIQSLYDTSNGFLEWRDTNIRTNDLSDFGLSTYNEIITGGLYTSGRGPLLYCWNGTPASIDDGGYFMHAPDEIDDTCVYLYPGSSIYFPVIYVGKNAKIYQNDVALPSGTFYLPLGYNNLICVPNNFGSFRLWYNSGTNIDDITFYYSYIYPSTNRHTSQNNMKIYRDGIDIGITNAAISGFDCVDILQKMVGVHIDPNGDGAFYEPVPVPDDIPYGDDGTVYVFVPIDRPRDIVYMSPETYNNYIDNGNITYDDSITNNVIDSGTVNNITNIYNNYGSGGGDFDDSRIVDRLDKIIDKLDKISSKLSDVYDAIKYSNLSKLEPGDFSDLIGDLFSSDDDYVQSEIDWRTLLETKFIIFKQCRELIENLQIRNSPLILQSENPLGDLLSAFPGYDSSKYDGLPRFIVNVNWFEKQYTSPMGTTKSGREYVRDGLGYIFYGITFAYIYRRTDSILADF